MNKTVTVNISGMVFYIEESGFEILRSYLDRLKAVFAGTAGGEDIVADIESRIAELFKARLGDEKQVVSETDVREVTTALGNPEDLADQDTSAESDFTTSGKRKNKRMYRDGDESIIGGVSAGLAHYFGLDPVWLRLGFTLLAVFGGSGIPIYIICWIVIPEAKSTAEKLNMRGQPVNLDNIKRTVEEEMKNANERIKSGAKRAERAFDSKKFKNGVENVGNALGDIVGKIAGICLVLFSFFILLGPVISYSVFDVIMGPVSPLDLTDLVFPDNGAFWSSLIGGMLVWLIPVSVIFYAGLKLLGVRTRSIPNMGWLLTLLFVSGVISLTVGAVKTGKQFTKQGETVSRIELLPSEGDTLKVSILDDTIFKYPADRYSDVEYFDLFKREGGRVYVVEPIWVGFETIDEREKPYLEVRRQSQGSDYDQAHEHADAIEYVSNADSTGIRLSSFLSFPEKDKIRGQNVEIEIGVPTGMLVEFDDRIRRICGNRDLGRGLWIRGEDEFIKMK